MSASPSPTTSKALIAGRYAVLRKLGSGSVGTVYLAVDERERREVALKVIRTEALIARSALCMQEEFRAIASLEHPQIARAHDFGYTGDGVPFYTREYVPGVPLPPGPPSGESPEAFLRPVLDLLEAIDYAHERGILHLDIHSGNLILADDPRRGAVLIDFGLAPTPPAIARSAGAAGWSALPPELLAGRPASVATDVYLAGRLLFLRLTGRPAGGPANSQARRTPAHRGARMKPKANSCTWKTPSWLLRFYGCRITAASAMNFAEQSGQIPCEAFPPVRRVK